MLTNTTKTYTLDVINWIETNCHIHDMFKGRIPFKLRDYQCNMLYGIISNDRLLINTARQLGLTSLVFAYCEYLLVNKNYNIGLVINNKAIIDRFINRSPILHAAVHADRLRIIRDVADIIGYRLDVVFINDMSFVRNVHQIIDLLLPAMPIDSKLIGYSTPHIDSYFNKLFIHSIAWEKRKYDWSVNEHWDSVWANTQILQLGKHQFDVEFNCKIN